MSTIDESKVCRVVEGCPLPRHCESCEACLPHCAGTSTWWSALKYFLRHWWSLGSWGCRQGGWFVPTPRILRRFRP